MRRTTPGSISTGLTEARSIIGTCVYSLRCSHEAVAWAAKNPAAQGGTVEVHPILSL